jgi:hypothetical protein
MQIEPKRDIDLDRLERGEGTFAEYRLTNQLRHHPGARGRFGRK